MIDKSEICVVIPCYNNVQTVVEVSLLVLQYIDNLIVVCDGCTDGSYEALKTIEDKIVLLSYSPNQGKGKALEVAFEYAANHNFKYAITMDADGQHYASDLPLFIQNIDNQYGKMLVGSRYLKQDNMPKGNTFANKFSNFWFALYTGCYLPDTQTGYRAYPLFKMSNMKLLTKRYEAELEFLVRIAWRNIKLVSLPVKVYYAPTGQRVTHFRKGRDFMRISVLNATLFFVAIFYGYPSRLIRCIFKKRNND